MDKPVERLFPFAARARIVVVGRDNLRRQAKHLHFMLLAEDLSDNSLREVQKEFPRALLIKRYSTEELFGFFGFRKAKILGFRKSALATNIYRELRDFRVATDGSAEPLPAEPPPADADQEEE